MALPTIFNLCEPRDDVRRGAVQETDFAADLAQVLRGDAPPDYRDPARFFANTHPTRGLKNLLHAVCARLSGSSEQVGAIFRLDTQFGGGKTHALIALVHAARSMREVPNAGEFVDLKLVPDQQVVVFGFEGENADPANGRKMGEGIKAFTPWGEMAYALKGKQGYDLVRASDEQCIAPGAETLRELLQGGPKLLLLDELGVYLRKLKGQKQQAAGAQLVGFLSALFSAVETTKNAALVFTLAIGKGGIASDAYAAENEYVGNQMAELESVSGRKATLLNPTEEDETPHVLRRRLFQTVGDPQAIVDAYRALWRAHQEGLPPEAVRPESAEALRASWPLHPELLHVFTHKMSTLENFQRVRGMLRFLARTVKQLWDARPPQTYAIHVHHLDPSMEAIKQEIVTKLGQDKLVPAISSDVAGTPQQPSLAEELDRDHYAGLLPFGSYVGRNILFHTLAYNEALRGVQRPELRFSILAPGIEPAYIDDAAKRFQENSSYLDDRTVAPLRFQYEANLNQLVKRAQQNVDKTQARNELKDRIKDIFGKGPLELVLFPAAPSEVPDGGGGGDGRPVVAVMGYDALEVPAEVDDVPELLERLYQYKGAGNDLRKGRNNLLFIVADQPRIDEMKSKMARRLALEGLIRPENLQGLAEHQQLKIKEMFEKSAQEVAIAVQQCYRHIFYPTRARLPNANVDLGHAAIDVQSASEKPGAGQSSVVRTLREALKLRVQGDAPDKPSYVRDRTPLKKGQISTATLREEFRRDAALPMLIGDEVFIAGIREGIEQGDYVYKTGDLLLGKGDPFAAIKIDENSFVFTMEHAKAQGIWPRPVPQPGGPGPTPQPPAPGAAPVPGQQPVANANDIVGEGVLKEALIRVWEEARKRKLGSIKKLSLQVFEGGDVFRLLGGVSAIPAATKRVELEGSYVTLNDGEMHVRLTGPIDDAKPVKDFLDPQIRAAADAGKQVNLEAIYQVTFNDGLSMAGDLPEKFSERLVKLSSGLVHVRATAEG